MTQSRGKAIRPGDWVESHGYYFQVTALADGGVRDDKGAYYYTDTVSKIPQSMVPSIEAALGVLNEAFSNESETYSEPDAASPTHYDFNGVQVIDITRHLSFPLGNVVKYVTRAGRKGDALEDLKKAQVYLTWAIEDAENERPSV